MHRLLVVLVVCLVPACSNSDSSSNTTLGPAETSSPVVGEPESTQTFTDLERTHLDTPVDYPQTPPVGGPHTAVWQSCAVYDVDFPKERGVHSMEHGAVWITYTAGLPEADIAVLKSLAESGKEVLVSPFTGLPTPVVATAWGKQLQLDSVSDPRLAQFVTMFDDGPQTPEVNTPCAGGISETD